jgi:hypothetical protein
MGCPENTNWLSVRSLLFQFLRLQSMGLDQSLDRGALSVRNRFEVVLDDGRPVCDKTTISLGSLNMASSLVMRPSHGRGCWCRANRSF